MASGSGAAGAAPLDLAGPAAPPRRNGELVFEAPWEGRLFGLTVTLHGQGRFEWEEFRRRLIREIALSEREAAAGGAPFHYYAAWRAALEDLLAAKGLCGAGELDTRERQLAARPHGHDHGT